MITHSCNIRPLSANEMWKGRRFKSSAYKKYEEGVLWLLPTLPQFPKPPYRVSLGIRLENKQADLDNPIKAFLDILQKKYGFNDKDVVEIHAYKRVVPKGQGGITWRIDTLRTGLI